MPTNRQRDWEIRPLQLRSVPAGGHGRRQFLAAVGHAGKALAAAYAVRSGAALLGPGAMLTRRSRAEARTREPLVPPSEIRSENGVLRATMTAASGRVQVGEFAFPGLLYNGAYVPPLLRPRLGDTMRITFRNQLPDDPSNLHYHGMGVSPQGNSDNVFIHVHPGQEFEYEVRIPAAGRQRPGFFWYHPHAHGVVAKQILGGMSGGLVVDGIERLFPILQGLPERFFLIKHVELGEGNEIISINGQINPVVQIRPGEMQFWRIGHIGATLFVKFRIEGMPLYVVAKDGHPLSRPHKITEFFIGPGQRIDAIAIGPEPGEYAMGTIPFQNQAWRKPDPARQLATIVSAGSGSASAVVETEVLRQKVDGARWFDEVRSASIARRRRLEYSRTPDRQVFMIDGRVMDENRVDQTVRLGDTEEWTVVNTDQQFHSFHIHQTGFLVTEVSGVSQNEDSLRDTFSVPPATDNGPGILKVAIPFTDPVIVGRFVFHCHAVDHEDKGMMGVVEVVA
jgi:FtsP/CotA-like multicopper oxidase with cupredoxin domain